MRLLLPEPETPVMATSKPVGIVTFTLRRLCSRAPVTEMPAPLGLRRRLGTCRPFSPVR